MARSRNLKPSFFKDAKVVACSFEARLLFEGLWCLSDYKGRLKYVPLEIKMEIFPGDDVNIEKCMEELADQKLIQIYTDDSGTTLVQVRNFSRHQNPHVNERQDKYKKPMPHLPGPDNVNSEKQEGVEEKPTKEQQLKDALVLLQEYYQSDPADSLNLIPDSLKPNPLGGDESPKEKPKRKTRLPDDFVLTPRLRTLACNYWVEHNRVDLDPDVEFEKFLLNHRSKGTLMLCWKSAWQTWYTNALRFNHAPRQQSDYSTPRQRIADATHGSTANDW